MTWIAIKDQLPEHKQDVLIYTNGKSTPLYDYAWFDKQQSDRFMFFSYTTDGCCRYNEIYLDEVLYWMPLLSQPGKESCQKPCELCSARHKNNHIPKVKT